MGDLSLPPSFHNLSESLLFNCGRYASEQERLKTFKDFNWPRNAPVPSESLARAGFFYTGNNLDVCCFSCNIICGNWNYGETAFRKHRQLNQNCPFVQQQNDIVPDRTQQIEIFTPQSNNDQLDHGRGTGFPVRAELCEYQRIWPNEYHSFHMESARRATFSSWPLSFVRPEDLARVGFVYLKVNDRVQCIFCHGIVTAWEEGDIPLQEHGRHFPSCPFIRGAYVNNVSIEREFRGHLRSDELRAAAPRLPGFDVCGVRPMNMNSFRPERYVSPQPAETYSELNIIEHSPPKYPSYLTKEARLKSYATWPAEIPQEVEVLIEAGLFYTGISDHVKCFQCGGGLKNWEAIDIPFEEHARWFSDCPFVNLSKGKEYIERVKKQKPPILKKNAEETLASRRNPNEISEEELDTLMSSEMVRAVLDMGMDHFDVRQTLKRRWQQVGYNFANSDLLAQAVLEMSNLQPTSVANPPHLCNGHNDGALMSETISASISGFQGNTHIGVNATATTSTEVSKVEDTSPENDFRLCKVCMDQEMGVVFLPCGHFVACANCAAQISNCPVCRSDIKGKVRTFWN